MSGIVFFIEQISFGLYLVIGAAILITLRRLGRSRRDYRGTYFELERELARERSANSWTLVALLFEAVLFVVGIQHVVAPTLRQVMTGSTEVVVVREDGDFITPTPGEIGAVPIDPSGVVLEEEDPALRVLATPTLTPTPVGTIISGVSEPIGCDTPNAQLQVPANGMVVFEPMTIIGTAFADSFAFYRFEVKGPSTLGSFVPREDHNIAVTETGVLGQFVPAFYEPGEYQFRITVFDSGGILKATCEVTIIISEPIPTPTPIGQASNLEPAPYRTPAPFM